MHEFGMRPIFKAEVDGLHFLQVSLTETGADRQVAAVHAIPD